MELEQGSPDWQNRWHGCVQKNFADLGSTRGTPRRVKQKRIMNSKVEFSEKLRNSFDERRYEKLAAKVGYVF